MFGRRARCLVFEADQLVDREVIQGALRNQASNLLVRCVQQLVRDRMAEAMTDASMPDNMNKEHALGRLAELAELRGELLLLTEPRTRDKGEDAG